MSSKIRPLWKSALAPAAVVFAALSVSACGGADDRTAKTASAEDIAVPADESAARDDAGVAAEMHNQMSGQTGNQTDAAAMPMDQDQMGAAGMGNGHMSGMMDDMPMGGGSMNKSGTASPAPMPQDKPMPMQDDM